MTQAIEIAVPDLGDFQGVEVIEVLVKAGDVIGVDAPLISLESDKATMEVPAPRAGVVASVAVTVGDKVSQGDPILTLAAGEGATKPPPATDPKGRAGTAPEAQPPKSQPPAPPGVAEASAPTSPSVRRLALERGVDVDAIRGTGPKGRITEADVEQAASRGQGPGAPGTASPPAQTDSGEGDAEAARAEFARFGPVTTRPLSRIRRLSGANLHETWTRVPHATHHDKADVTDLETFRRTLNAPPQGEGGLFSDARMGADAKDADARAGRVTLLPFLMKAAAATLEAFPLFNAALSPDGGHLILKAYYHLGVAVDTPDGLVVPVIRDVDRKGIRELAGEIATVNAKARAGKLTPGEMQGGCFTLSSLGGIGGTGFTPIINAPEVAILGIARARREPVYAEGGFAPRLLLPLSLAYDHRVVDGVAGARFMAHLCGLLADIRQLLI